MPLDTTTLLTTTYLAAGVLFILSLSGLSTQETARRGNIYGIAGMAIALAVTVFFGKLTGFGVIGGAIGIGVVIGAVLAARVKMTGMPELVAILHSFVGLAAVLVGVSSYVGAADHALSGTAHTIHLIEVYIGVAVGAVTFTGSIVAWGKLRGTIGGRPMLLPARHALNAVLFIACVALMVPFVLDHDGGSLTYLLVMTGITCFLGFHLVMAIGGADMPVVVSMLNSYSGWAAAAAGFMLGNDLLIVTGALVGSSGAILSYIMCKAMNRSIWAVIFGGFGTSSGAMPAVSSTEQGEVIAVDTDGVIAMLGDARDVLIVPGYGMAVAQAQHPVKEFGELLRKRDIRVRYVIHPVAGRLPGHMNVLLAEAGVPYDIVHEMDELVTEVPRSDMVLVIGANDIVNPAALDDASSPIYGMPVIEAWKSRHVIVLKRGMAAGYAGIENPLFFKENTRMLFGDAKVSMDALNSRLRIG